MRVDHLKAGAHQLVEEAGHFLCWASVIAIAILSLLPTERLVRTGIGGHVEHVIAYAGTAAALAVTYGQRGISRILFAMLIYAGVLEFLQRYSPGRVSSLRDFVFSAAGVLVGLAMVAVCRWLFWPKERNDGHAAQDRIEEAL
jgi:VanZ family protein